MIENDNYTREELNAFIFEYNIPVVVFVTFFILLGVVGNSLVLFIYMFRMKSSTLTVFIAYLGFVDMLGCCLGVPLSMVELFLPVMYPWDFLCKLEYIAIFYSCVSSVLSIFFIAVERFNRVCRPLSPQMSPLFAKRAVFGITLLSLLASVPIGLIFRRKKTQLKNGVTAYGCWSPYDYWKYFFILLSFFCILLVIIFVLYFFIWKSARQHFRQHETLKHINEVDHLTNSNQETKHQSTQVNMMIFSITALFVISFTPYFLINLVQSEFTNRNYTLSNILKHFWVLNCSLNPIVYGICNGKFQREIKRIFYSPK